MGGDVARNVARLATRERAPVTIEGIALENMTAPY
jgi:hypothetical protein